MCIKCLKVCYQLTVDVSCDNLMYFFDKEEICPLVFIKTGHHSFISIIQDQFKLIKILTMSKRPDS